jgi:hypothetical protein
MWSIGLRVKKGYKHLRNNIIFRIQLIYIIKTTFDRDEAGNVIFGHLAQSEIPQKTEAQASNFSGISFGIDRHMSRVHRTYCTQPASHQPRQILGPAKTPVLDCDGP